MIKIFIADDHAIVREGLKQIVADSSDMVVSGEASNGQETLDKIFSNDNDYEVVLLDITLPDRHGLDILKELKSQRPEIRVLVLTMHPEEQYAIRALRAGASGYLTKESAPDELIAAIRKVSLGAKYVSQSLAEKLASSLDTESDKPLYQPLSDREYQVMCMIASGKTTQEIAQKLLLSIKTVSTYRSRLLSKMKMHNNAQLISYAIENRLLD